MNWFSTLAIIALAAAPTSVPGKSSNDIAVPLIEDARAPSRSTLKITCGGMRVNLVSAYGDNGTAPVSLSLNGRQLDLTATGLASRIGLTDRLYKYTPLCAANGKNVYIRYYSVYQSKEKIMFVVGRFTVNLDGILSVDEEESVEGRDFFFG